jgi:glyoxylase-like metal-dependent hydrolase (beta-lactamase superfamily II)
VNPERIGRVSTHVTRVRAPNPSPMTLDGTNSYLIDAGARGAIAIDPGPPDRSHVDLLVETAAADHREIRAILVTHGHPDHAPGAALLKAHTRAPVYAHPEARFAHDVVLRDGETLDVEGAAVLVEHSPGHARDHCVFTLRSDDALFTGDVIVGRGTVVVAPPGGDMRAYQATLERLRERHGGARVILGGHGEPVHDVATKIDDYIAHRIERERQVIDALEASGPLTIPAIVERIYTDTDPVLWPAAGRQVLAYLEALEREDRVRTQTLVREPTPFEASLLHPDLSRIVDAQAAAVARAELGFDEHTPLKAYQLK